MKEMKRRTNGDIEEALHQHLSAIVALYEIAAGSPIRGGKYVASFDFRVDRVAAKSGTFAEVFIGTLDIVHESEMQ